jgi:3',5'-cyclic-AMP phosphodiesterase
MKKSVFILLTVLFFGYACQKTGVEQSKKDEFTFVFMTDIHVQPEKNAIEGFEQSIDSVNKLHPDFVITGGDLIMDALGVGYERADSLYDMYTEISKNFTMPVYNTIGNHDVFGLYPESGIQPDHPEYMKKMYEKKIGKRYYSFDHKNWHFMILDAIGDTPERRYIGEIDSVQIDWIKSELKSLSKSTPIALSVHIPFITSYTQLSKGTLEPNAKGLVITNGKEVLELFMDYNLKLVLQGHLHYLEDIFVNQQIHFITAGAVSGGWWNGPHNRAEEGFLLVKIKGEEVKWDYVDYGWEVK